MPRSPSFRSRNAGRILRSRVSIDVRSVAWIAWLSPQRVPAQVYRVSRWRSHTYGKASSQARSFHPPPGVIAKQRSGSDDVVLASLGSPTFHAVNAPPSAVPSGPPRQKTVPSGQLHTNASSRVPPSHVSPARPATPSATNSCSSAERMATRDAFRSLQSCAAAAKASCSAQIRSSLSSQATVSH